MSADLDADRWATLLDGVEPATRGEAERALEEADVFDGDAVEAVAEALEAGILVEEEGAGAFPRLTVAGAGGSAEGVSAEEGGEEVNHVDADEGGGGDGAGRTSRPSYPPKEAHHVDEKGGGEAADGRREAALAAFADAVEWYHSQLDAEIQDHTAGGEHPERAATAREWFVDVRGFDPDTVADKRLGWAPPDAGDELLAHLHRRGHDREAIRATGLFTHDLRPLWNGRYVFPYFDEEGRPAYAIARCTGDEGGGDAGYDGHPADFIAGKYAKLAHTKEHVELAEPIYGLATLDRDGPVLITEGVADAIRAHEHGYACVSPVTTQFKREHREALLGILDGVGRPVYVVQDAERPPVDYTDDVDGWEALGIQQYGPGLKGAVRTAAHLRAGGVDAYLAELPRPGLGKVDLDDYLGGWADTLDAVLASARPAEEHPAYEPGPDREAGDTGSWTDDLETSDSESTGGDLTADDVREALDHVDTALPYDDWIQLAYAVHDWNPSPEGRRIFEAWSRKSPKWEDPTSSRAIKWVWENATAGGKTTVATLIYRATKGGWDPPTTSGERAPEAVLPLERLAALDDDEVRRFARHHGLEWPDTEEVRDRLEATVRAVMRAEDRAVVDAPTSAGKSHLVATTPWRDVDDGVTGGAPVVALHATKDARDEFATATGEELGRDGGRRLRAGPEACPVAAGRHDPEEAGDDDERRVVTVDGRPASEWFDEMCRDRGIPFSVAHARARERNDQGLPELPCCPGDQMCHSQSQYAGVPRNDEGDPAADVIHATHQFAHVPALRHGVNIVFDEEPDFTADLDHDRAQRAVTAFLKLSDAGPDTWEELVGIARRFAGNDLAKPWNEHAEPGERADLDEFRGVVEALEYEPSREWYFSDPDAHTLAKPVAGAVFDALYQQDPFDATGRATARRAHHPPRFDDDAREEDYWNREYVTVVVDDDNRIRRVRSAPDFSGARSVVGLDAHPTTRVWRRNVGPDVTREAVLGREERRLWRVLERGLTVVQVGDAVRPKGRNGEYYDREGDAALVEAIRDEFGPLRSGVVPKAVREEFVDVLEAAGADVPRDDAGDPERVLTFGEEKSRNDLAGEPVGYVSHSLDPGDEYILDWLAECDLEAVPSRVECPTCDGEGCPECDGTGERREHGRTFEGADAAAAAEFLGTVREQHLIQSAGRYARDPDDPDDGATVFVRSSALPEAYADVQVSGVEWLATDTQRDVVAELRRRPSATARELADAVGTAKEHVRQTLTRLADRGAVEVREHAGDHGAHVYRAVTGAPTTAAVVDLDPEGERDETTNADVWGSSTWALVVRAPNAPTPPDTDAPDGVADGSPGPNPGVTLGLEAFDRGPPGG